MSHVKSTEPIQVVWCILCVIIAVCTPITATNCDVTIHSLNAGNKSGIFTSPNWPNPYDNNMRCIYRFIGLPNEKVSINITKFYVKGVHQRCQDDYVDVYTQVRDPTKNLLEIPLHGRYCGTTLDYLPHLLISMYHVIILGFYTDTENTEKGFKGHYNFFDGSMYTIGTTAAPNACGQTIFGDSLPHGTILSPTYPGMYPDNVFCYYKLIGKPGQRIRFTFEDLDMYSGGEHCPYDYIKIYDGYTNEAEVIGTYCGKLKKLRDLKGVVIPPDIFSTAEAMLIEFVTKSGRVEPTKKSYIPYWAIEDEIQVRQKGFNASFEFSDRFVKLDFISDDAEHVRGTQCDQRVCSQGESNGTITTPNYPDHYPPNITCKFYIDGLVDKQNLEKTNLSFMTFDIPSTGAKCETSFVKAYKRGQDIQKKPKEYDAIMCGEVLPASIESNNPRLLLVFKAGLMTGQGFMAHYRFLIDYAIPGTPAYTNDRDGTLPCHFFYRSGDHSKSKTGTFNSPRNPSHYPTNTECQYELVAMKDEQIRITFDSFELQKNDPGCTHDYISLYMVTRDKVGRSADILVGRYCGENVPGPMMTDKGITEAKVIFHSDSADVSAGFKARYDFVMKKVYGDKCDENHTETGSVIYSPNSPNKYTFPKTCTHHIYAQTPNAKIMLQFVTFSVEGVYDTITKVYQCPNAVLKIFTRKGTGKPQYEICGDLDKTLAGNLPVIISEENYAKVKFLTGKRATGMKGFSIAVTELLQETADGQCGGFKCKKTGYCIASSLYCNDVPNCGLGDTSDEPSDTCDSTYTDHGVLHIILGVVISSIVLVFIIVCILHRRRKARKKKNKKEIEVRYVTRGGTPNRGGGPITEKLLRERTEKVSIV